MTIWLAEYMGTVISSCLIGLSASFIPIEKLRNLAFCASFVGMTSFYLSLNEIILTSVISILLFNLLEKKFITLGGKLGMIAFVAVSIGCLI